MSSRVKNRGKVLLRRSTNNQEKSLSQQLDWAVARANEVGITLDASQDDLALMQKNCICRYKDMYVDDAITGANLSRPGLSALRTEVIADRSVSHLFIYLPDRLARPEEPTCPDRNVGLSAEKSRAATERFFTALRLGAADGDRMILRNRADQASVSRLLRPAGRGSGSS